MKGQYYLISIYKYWEILKKDQIYGAVFCICTEKQKVFQNVGTWGLSDWENHLHFKFKKSWTSVYLTANNMLHVIVKYVNL